MQGKYLYQPVRRASSYQSVRRASSFTKGYFSSSRENPVKVMTGIAVFVGAVLGFFVGRYIESRKKDTPEHAARIVLDHQKTWKLQRHEAEPDIQGGREAFWVSLFQPRFTAAAAFVIFHDNQTNKKYLLLTLQERVVDGKSKIFCEPPMGFYNGEYSSKNIPHVVAEEAEREIDNCVQRQEEFNQVSIYQKKMEAYARGELSHDPYKEDDNLWATAYREVKEEAGLDILNLSRSGDVLIERRILSEWDKKDGYISARKIDIFSNKLPQLQDRNGCEVKYVEWVEIDKIDFARRIVQMSQGEFEIKPRAYLSQFFDEVIALEKEETCGNTVGL